jgi:PadR family transcriptional regulator PadR
LSPSSLVLIQGTLELLILKTLEAGGEQHGFGILEFIRQATEDRLVIEEGALYPALHRMEARGWIDSEWGTSEKGRKARYYRLTRKGKVARKREDKRWASYVAAVANLAPRTQEG